MRNRPKTIIKTILLISIIMASMLLPLKVKAVGETMYFVQTAPAQMNTVYNIQARVNPNGTAINAAQFQFTYSTTLDILSIDINSSAFEFVAEKSNVNNKITIAVGTTQPISSDTLLATVNVRPRASGLLAHTPESVMVKSIDGSVLSSTKQDEAINPANAGIMPVYRFWSDKNKKHFYTSNEAEKTYVQNNYASNVWQYEGIVYYAKEKNISNSCTTGVPLYRFWSDSFKGHFYTSNEAEKTYVQNNYASNVWRYESIAFCVGTSPDTHFSIPLYRFWSDSFKGHFYTSNEAEKTYVQNNYASNVWRYEGISGWIAP